MPFRAAFITVCARWRWPLPVEARDGDAGGSGGSGGSVGTGGGDGLGGEGNGGETGANAYAALESIAKPDGRRHRDDRRASPTANEAPHIDHLPPHIAGALEGLGFAFLDGQDEFEL